MITLARRTPVAAASAVAVLGPDDLLIQWPKPVWNKGLSYSKEEWQALPEHLNLRQIKVTINVPGMRSASYYLITTLTDWTRYGAAELADLYRQRWDVELFFRDIKTTMGMDVLRCRTPDLVRKEILMYFIAYNAVRRLIVDAANAVECAPRRISFKASNPPSGVYRGRPPITPHQRMGSTTLRSRDASFRAFLSATTAGPATRTCSGAESARLAQAAGVQVRHRVAAAEQHCAILDRRRQPHRPLGERAESGAFIGVDRPHPQIAQGGQFGCDALHHMRAALPP